ncbi:ClpP/crotonase-like domain-containing protein [Hyaloraphidium curvatum]|nr:ClpP/crotonase-like domain-containing protein [Hyaloraphidium curvatum]
MDFGPEFGAKGPLVRVSREGPLYVLTMHEKENRFTGPFMKSLVAALEKIRLEHEAEGNPPAAVVTVSSEDRIWSNGLDLTEVGARGQDYIKEFQGVLEKFLTFPMATVAAMNGHAFAGGFLLALAHDYRTFRGDRGWVCMPEIDMPAPMSQGLLGILKAKLGPRDFRDVMLYGNRLTAPEAHERGIVDAVGKGPAETIELGKELGRKWATKARAGMIMGLLKNEMYSDAKRELLQMTPSARPTPEQMKRLQENVAKGAIADAKAAAAAKSKI